MIGAHVSTLVLISVCVCIYPLNMTNIYHCICLYVSTKKQTTRPVRMVCECSPVVLGKAGETDILLASLLFWKV